MDHHIGDMQHLQIEHAAEHVARGALDIAFLMQNIDRALQLLIGREHRAAMAELDADEAEHPANDPFHRREQWPEDQNEGRNEAHDAQ